MNRSDSNILSGLAGVVIGVTITTLVVLCGVGLLIAAGRAANYAPAITQATQSPTPALSAVEGATPATADPRVTVITTTLDSGGALSVTFEAAQISGDILFAPPVWQVGDRPDAKHVEGATPESLKAARLAMLAAITDGKATVTLTFADVPPDIRHGALIFNPSSQPGNIVNPRIEAAIVW